MLGEGVGRLSGSEASIVGSHVCDTFSCGVVFQCGKEERVLDEEDEAADGRDAKEYVKLVLLVLIPR